MTDTTAEITLSRWTNPAAGQHHRYLDGWAQAIGLIAVHECLQRPGGGAR